MAGAGPRCLSKEIFRRYSRKKVCFQQPRGRLVSSPQSTSRLWSTGWAPLIYTIWCDEQVFKQPGSWGVKITTHAVYFIKYRHFFNSFVKLDLETLNGTRGCKYSTPTNIHFSSWSHFNLNSKDPQTEENANLVPFLKKYIIGFWYTGRVTIFQGQRNKQIKKHV